MPQQKTSHLIGNIDKSKYVQSVARHKHISFLINIQL